jgi:hypothetical protein
MMGMMNGTHLMEGMSTFRDDMGFFSGKTEAKAQGL